MTGGGQAPSTTTANNAPPAYALPGLTLAANQAVSNYQGQQPQYYTGSVTAPFSNQTQQALDMTQNLATTPNPTLNSANTQLNNVINNTGTNPFLSGAVSAATQPLFDQFTKQVLPQLQSSFALGGRSGSGAAKDAAQQATTAFGRGAAEQAAQLANASANEQQAAQLAAIQQAPNINTAQYTAPQALANVGATYDTQNQANLNNQINAYNYNQNLPALSLNQLIQQLQGSVKGGTTVTTAQQQPSSLGLAGGALAGGAVGSLGGPPGTVAGATLGALYGLGSQNGWF